MELLQQIMEGLWAGFQALVNALAPLVAAIASAIFGVQVSSADARGFTVVLLVMIFAWAISKAFFGVANSPSIQPQKITFTTDKTPAQIVLGEWAKRFRSLLIFGIVMLILYFVGTAMVSD